jgi:hypothetical protein
MDDRDYKDDEYKDGTDAASINSYYSSGGHQARPLVVSARIRTTCTTMNIPQSSGRRCLPRDDPRNSSNFQDNDVWSDVGQPFFKHKSMIAAVNAYRHRGFWSLAALIAVGGFPFPKVAPGS